MCLFLSKFQQLSELDLTEMLKKNFRFAIIQTVVFGRHPQQKVFSKSPLTSSIRWEKREMTDKETSIGHNPLTKHFISSGSSIKNTSVITPFYTRISDTMYKGLRAGFMDLFFGVGKNFWETEYINFFAKFGIGAAGGRIFPENGLTMYPSTGFDLKFTEHFGLSFHGGTRSIGATFEALTARFEFKILRAKWRDY